MNTKFTKGEWKVKVKFSRGSYSISSINGINACRVCDLDYYGNNKANANLIAASPDMYAMVESLSHELNMAIDEINTMRDIHHTDNLTPADHWDKESLHDAQVLLAKARGEIT